MYISIAEEIGMEKGRKEAMFDMAHNFLKLGADIQKTGAPTEGHDTRSDENTV